jgi:hypothetical protein
MNINYNFDGHFLWNLCSEEHKKTFKVPNWFANIFIEYFDKINRLKDINNFIETGTYLGHTSIVCSQLFDTVDTIELFDDHNPYVGISLKELYSNITKDYSNIKIHIGESFKLLNAILAANPNTPYVFLLDAHTNGYTPLMKELEAIKINSKTNQHIIMIDDCNATGGNYPPRNDIINKLLDINPNYTIEYHNNNNIMVAF